MDLQFRFRRSAFKHNVTEADIRHANEFGENGVNVFHAMACQDRFLRLLEEGEHYDGN
jgi:hypothetical protein